MSACPGLGVDAELDPSHGLARFVFFILLGYKFLAVPFPARFLFCLVVPFAASFVAV
jgi:hypothetical protein